jgi:hypothetical protein
MLVIKIEDEHITSFIVWSIGWKFALDCMENSSKSRGKRFVVDKPSNSYTFTFLHLEIEKPPPYVGDIWVSWGWKQPNL